MVMESAEARPSLALAVMWFDMHGKRAQIVARMRLLRVLQICVNLRPRLGLSEDYHSDLHAFSRGRQPIRPV